MDDFIGGYVSISIKESIIKLKNSSVVGDIVRKFTHYGLAKEEM